MNIIILVISLALLELIQMKIDIFVINMNPKLIIKMLKRQILKILIMLKQLILVKMK